MELLAPDGGLVGRELPMRGYLRDPIAGKRLPHKRSRARQAKIRRLAFRIPVSLRRRFGPLGKSGQAISQGLPGVAGA
jgi:hypothetical protein